MKYYLLSSIFLFSACSLNSNNKEYSANQVNLSESIQYQMHHVYETDWNEHYVYIYFLNTQSTDTLKLFCKQLLKEKCKNEKVITIRAAFFDDKQIARLPETSSLRYISDEAMQHLKAYLYIDPLCNGEIELYKPNLFEGTREIIPITLTELE